MATSNSWRRIMARTSRGDMHVCEPVVHRDGHPDLHFRNGGSDGPDARLVLAAPEMAELLGKLLREFSLDVSATTGKVRWVCGSCQAHIPENAPAKHKPNCLIEETRAFLARLNKEGT